MLNAVFPSVRQMLCLGAHADDIEIGCGGTVLKLVSLYPDADFHWVVFSAPGIRKEEAESSAGRFLRDAGSKTIEVQSFRDGFFPYVGADIKDFFEALKKTGRPGHDLHPSRSRSASRPSPPVRADLEHLSRPLDPGIRNPEVRRRNGIAEPLRAAHPGRAATEDRSAARRVPFTGPKKWFNEVTFDALLRLRGIESNSPSGYSEGYYCRKLCCF